MPQVLKPCHLLGFAWYQETAELNFVLCTIAVSRDCIKAGQAWQVDAGAGAAAMRYTRQA